MIKIGDKHYFTNPNWKLGFFWSGNVKAARASLRRNRWRSFFTMLGVVIGVSSVVTIVSLGQGFKHQVTGQVQKLGNNVIAIRPGKVVSRDSKGNIDKVNYLSFFNASTLTNNDVKALQGIKSIESIAPIDFVTSSAVGDSGAADNVAVIGTNATLGELLNIKMDYGNFLTDSGPDSAIVGSSAAEDLFSFSNPFAHNLKINDHDFIVRGVMAPTAGGLLSVGQTDFNSAVFIPYDYAKLLTNGQVNLVQILAKVKPGYDTNKVAKNIEQVLLASHGGSRNFTVLKPGELKVVADKIINNLTSFLASIAAISLLVAGIGIMDIMLVAVSERTREIGIRKAIGATNRQILNQFMTEGLVLSMMGGFLGIIVSLAIFGLLRIYTGLHPVLTWQAMLIAVGMSLIVGIIFSGAPALKAARKLPIDALRGE